MATLLWGLATAGMLFAYPKSNPLFTAISMSYCVFYFLLSLYRTFVPVDIATIESQDSYLPSE
jgi:phosphatidylcholine synthase